MMLTSGAASTREGRRTWRKGKKPMNVYCRPEDLIIYEDSSVIVLRKPAGLAVESRRVTETDLASLLRRYTGESHIVHRLDQGVEGLLAAAKTKRAAAALSAQLTDGRMKKVYLAKVDGVIPAEEGTLSDWLVRDPGTNVSRIVPPPAGGERKAKTRPKEARLFYRRLSGDVVAIRLFTGRHHQIRVQLAHAGMPVRGDRKYGSAAGGGLCLAAVYLSFIHPDTGRKAEFRTEPRLFEAPEIPRSFFDLLQ